MLRSSAIRAGLALFALFAWFSVSNHCALGAVALAVVETKSQAACPFHSKAPEKKSKDVTCCKVLRATLVTMAKTFTDHDASTFSLKPYFVARIFFTERFPAHILFEFDTGPPLARSFAELVLQRSILAHAPPFSLS